MVYYSAMRNKEILPFMTVWMTLEDIMLSEISQTQKEKYCVISKKIVLRKTGSRMVVARSWSGENGKRLGKKSKLIRYISSRDLKYSMVTIINNNVLYT